MTNPQAESVDAAASRGAESENLCQPGRAARPAGSAGGVF